MTTSFDDMPELDLSELEIEETVTAAPPRTRKPRSDAGKPRAARRKISGLADQLLVPWATLTLAVSQPLPLVGAVLADRGEATTKALVDLASDHPKMLAALQKAAKAGPASELVQTGAMIVLAAMIEIGRIPPDMPIAQKAGMTDAYYQLHPDRIPDAPDVPAQGMPFNMAPPPGFPSGFPMGANVA